MAPLTLRLDRHRAFQDGTVELVCRCVAEPRLQDLDEREHPVRLLPEPEAIGLLALMLLHESRRAARTSPAGDVVLLDDQDRSRWNRAQNAEGSAVLERALGPTRQEPERRFLERRLSELPD